MKEIKVYIRHHLRLSGSFNVDKADQIARQSIHNRFRIVEGALSIERNLVRMISHYFYDGDSERKQEFDDLILNLITVLFRLSENSSTTLSKAKFSRREREEAIR